MADNDEPTILSDASARGIPFNWMHPPDNDVNTASIYPMSEGWRVSTTNERATEEAIETYSDRADAVNDFASRVDGFVRYQDLRKRLLGR